MNREPKAVHGDLVCFSTRLTAFKCLDSVAALGEYLNMVKNDAALGKGEQTRNQIFESALKLFRDKGFDSTTMQDIAAHAHVVKSEYKQSRSVCARRHLREVLT